MSSKRVMPDMFAAAPARPPRVDRAASKFNHHVPAPVVEQEPKAAPEKEQQPTAQGVDTAAQKVVAPAPGPAERAEPVAAAPLKPRVERIPQNVVRSAEEEDVWAAFDVPHIPVVIPVFEDPRALLRGPLAQTPVHLLPAMEQAFQRIKASVRSSGRRVSFQTLYAHALAHAYTHADEWLSLAPSDGRREGSRSKLTSANTRITPELPVALIDATHALVAKATLLSPKHAPALESVKTAALAWSLGRYHEWLDFAVANPVKAGERVTKSGQRLNHG